MKIDVSDDLSADDIPAISLGLYHTSKSLAAGGLKPENSVEFTLSERSNDAFRTYLDGMYASVIRIIND